MHFRSHHPVALLSWAAALGTLVLVAISSSGGVVAVLAVLAAILVFWRFPPMRDARVRRPGDLLRTTTVGPRRCDPDRLRPVLVRDLEFLQGLTAADPLPPHLEATEIALRAMRRGGVFDPRDLSDRDVVALSLLRDAILAEPPKAARLSNAFHDPGVVLDLRDRVRSGTVFEIRPKRVA